MTGTLVNTPRDAFDLRSLLGLLPQGIPIAIDCETTGLHPYQGDKLRGFSIAFRQRPSYVDSFYIPVGYPEGNLSEHDVEVLVRKIIALDPIYVYHHSKFDVRFARQLPGGGFPVPGPGKLWDTKIVAFLMDENYSSSLDAQAELHLGEKKSEYMKQLRLTKGTAALIAEGVKRPKQEEALDRGWREITAEDTGEYGARDAELTLRLRERQLEMIDGKHPLIHGDPAPAIERMMQVEMLLLRVEDNGTLVDTGLLEELREKAEIECQEIEHYFTEHYATNINSTKQLGELLYDTLEMEVPAKTPGGKRSTARAALEQLTGDERFGHLIHKLLTQRRLSKALSSYLVPLGEHVAPDGRVHPTFWGTGTVTGRFSCSDPNLQTIPRADTLEGVRDVFVAEEGFELWEYDLAAAELRVMAGMAGETNLMRQLEEGADMHSENAAAIFGENFTPLQRRASKNIMYGWSYGLTKRETASKYIISADVSFAQAMKISDTVLLGIKKLYPKIFALMNRMTREADLAGVVDIGPAWPGRYRRFVTESARKPRTYTALNAKVQGGIGEFMKDVMLEVEPKLAVVGARINLQVHDSLVSEVPAGEGKYVQEILQEAADKLNPFLMPMIFDGKPWEQHD